MKDDDKFIVKGPPALQPTSNISFGKLIYDELIKNPTTNPAFIDAVTNRSINYYELLKLSCSLAESLQNHGYNHNDVAAICCENILEYFLPVLASLYTGVIVSPINFDYKTDEILHIFHITQPKLVFCSKRTVQKFIDSYGTIQKYCKRIIVLDGDDNGNSTVAVTLSSFIRDGLRNKPLIDRFLTNEFDYDQHIAFILCSSGTTGLPKGVAITHKSIVAKSLQWNDGNESRTGKTFMGILPFFHAYGLFTSIFSILHQAKVVILSKFDEHIYLKSIETYKISELLLVPPLAMFLAQTPLIEKYDLSSIKYVACGAAPLPKQIEEIVMKRLNVDKLHQGYGLTETILGVTRTTDDAYKVGSVGRLLPGILCKIRNPETGESLGPNRIGEICIKGPTLMKCYYNNPEATKNTFTKGNWLLTGDLGYYDQDGFFYIVDRLKEIIKYKGFQVAPAELEALLLKHPKIVDAAVVGLPDEKSGELPLAFIVKRPKITVTEKEIEDYVAGKVSNQKQLRGGVVFVGSIPRNPSGKILRRQLKEMLNRYKRAKL